MKIAAGKSALPASVSAVALAVVLTVVPAVVAAVVLTATPGQLSAQSWNLDTYAGRASYETAPSSVDSRTGVVGLRFSDDDRFFTVSGGVPFSDADVAWGVVAVGDRFALRRGGFVAGADLSMLAHGHRDVLAEVSGRGTMAELLPFVSHHLGPAVLELRSGPRHYRARHVDTAWTRTFWTTGLKAMIEPAPGLRLESDMRLERGEDGEEYSRLGGAVGALLGPVAVHGALGGWVQGLEDADPEWSLSLMAPVRSRLKAFANVRHESFDPHFLNPPRTSWGVGLTVRVGGRRAPAPAAGAEVREERHVVLRLPLRDAPSRPYLAGDFTNWEEVPMHRHGNEWRLAIDVPPGAHRFAFRDGNGRWFVPEGVPNRMDDGMGGWHATMIVP